MTLVMVCDFPVRRPLHDKRAAACRLGDCHGLRTVGVDHVIQCQSGDRVVDRHAVRDERIAFRKAVSQQCRDHRVSVDRRVLRPILRIEIAVHEELREGEEPQHHRIGKDFPPRLLRYGPGDLCAVGGEVEFVLVVEIFYDEIELAAHLLLKCDVRGGRLAATFQPELLGGRTALEFHGKQNKRRMPGRVGTVGVVPPQQAYREIEDIDALFLFERARVIPDVEQPLLQALRGQAGLQAKVRMPRCDASGIDRVGVAWLRDPAGFDIVGIERRLVLGAELHAR